MAKKASGKARREGVALARLVDMFPDEAAAAAWFEIVIWPEGRHCPKGGAFTTCEVPNAKPTPCWRTDGRACFSARTGAAMQRSKIPRRKWAIAIHLCLTGLKSVSSTKLQRDMDVSQPTAWFMLRRIRQAWSVDEDDRFDGPVDAEAGAQGRLPQDRSEAS